jgi:hypothetical protein
MALKDHPRSGQKGAALIIVLSVVALLSVMVIAYLGSSSRQMNLSQNAVVNLKGAEVASLASGQIISDLLQEIRAGSVEVLPAGAPSPIYYAANALGAAPDRSSVTTPAGVPPPNLVKQSTSGKAAYDAAAMLGALPAYPQAAFYPVAARASNVASDTGAGAVSLLRWNRPLLLPRAQPADALNFTPATTGKTRFAGSSNQTFQWKAPDWVYLQKTGTNPVAYDPVLKASGANPVIARYAYQMYDIGGLLDLNVAGYDPDTSVVGPDLAARRGSIGLADLTQVGLTAAHLKKLVAERNPSTLADKDTPVGQLSFGNRYVNFLLDGQKNLGFLRVAGGTGTSGVTNRAFSSRQNLLSYLQQLGTTDVEKAALVEGLQSLTHFSRSLEQPSFKPGFFDPKAAGSTPKTPVFARPTIVPPAGKIDDALYSISVIPNGGTPSALPMSDTRKSTALGGPLPWDMGLGNNRGGNDAWGTVKERAPSSPDTRPLQDVINPGFLEVRVKTSFKRLDGTAALAGEPLVKKRFPLERLAWLTYKGPSALLTASDELYNPAGTVLAIYDAFGLTWTRDPAGYWFWAYDHGKKGGVYKLEDLIGIAALPANAPKGAKSLPREPDFFELLKATIGVGSLGKPSSAQHRTGQSWDVATYYQARDRNSTFQLLEIAANIIDQYDADSFPTMIRLPNPDPSLPTAAYRYSPPLFTARGMEDLPYFYRFHWRGIEDAQDKPNKPLPGGAPAEITGSLGAYSGAGFRCGTTFLMGFPELWNPHALNGNGVPDKLVPTQFRVLAANETPQDLIVSPMNPSDLLDKGFSNLPKQGNLPKTDSTSKLWMQFVNNNWYEFCIQPVGYFAYMFPFASASQWTPTWLHDSAFSTQSSSMSLSGSSWTWSWPVDQLMTTNVTQIFGADNRSRGLFWSGASKRQEGPGDLVFPNRWANYFLALTSMWKIPAGITTDEDFLKNCMLPMPTTWPPGALSFPTLPDLDAYVASGISPFVLARQLYRIGSGVSSQTYTYDLTDKKLKLMYWPATPDPYKLFFTASYTVGDGIRGPGPLSLHSGAPMYRVNAPASTFYPPYIPGPEPTFPAYRQYLVAMTDRPGIQRALLESNPSATLPPMSPTAWNGVWNPNPPGNPYANNNRVVDMRGTELTFNLSNASVFREPSVLCQPGLPVGSNLAAGADNFFSKKPYGGSVQGTDGANWVGFSMGEMPSQYIAMAKMFKRDRATGYDKRGNLSAGVQGDDPAQDVFQNKLGAELTDPSTNYMVAGPGFPSEYYKLRFFQVPVTLAGIRNNTKFTVRVQYRDPISLQWVTYDERFMETDPSDNGRWTSMPVVGKSEITPVSNPPQDSGGNVAWRDMRRPIGWNAPLITSYDPRSPRFGHPMRYGYNWPESIRGTAAHKLQQLNPSPSTLGDSGFFPRTTAGIGKHNSTDRPASAVIDLPAGSSAQTTTPRWLVPAHWNNWVLSNYGNSESLRSVYDFITGAKPADALNDFYAQWWAMGRDPLTKKTIYQYPSANAYDYGWLPRLANPAPAGAFPKGRVRPGVTPDATLPNFWQDAPEPDPSRNFYADSLRIGDFSENIAPAPLAGSDLGAPYRQAYADPDDVVRRASGALAPLGGYSPAVPIEGLPQGQGNTTAASNRPVMLNRPFRAVAEMGSAFRGAPWKQVDFFLPESADAALLDVFCLSEPPPLPVSGGSVALTAAPPLIAGKVNLNTRQEPVLRAMLAGALKDETATTTSTGRLSAAASGEAVRAAQALIDRTTGTKPWQGPLANNAELVGKLFAKDLKPAPAATDPVYTSTVYKTATEPARNPDIGANNATLNWHFTGLSSDLNNVFSATKDRKTKRLRESIMRALADGGQTRVWNLMFDIVVQSGKFSAMASKLNDFVKDGETRLWVFIAIDRLTGEILDQQLEWVTD